MSVARDGLASLHQRMRVVGRDGEETALDSQVSAPARWVLTTVTVAGTGAARKRTVGALPRRAAARRALLRRLDGWVTEGVIEPSCADAVRTVAANPGWLALPGRTVVALGAGAEMGPLPVLLSWGARVIGVDLPRPVHLGAGPGNSAAQRRDAARPGSRGTSRAPSPEDGRISRNGQASTWPATSPPSPTGWSACRRPAGARQLRLRRRRGQCSRRQRRRRADRAPAGRAQ